MACNADARVHHFYFNSCDDANDFIDRIDAILDNYGRITLQDMDSLAEISVAINASCLTEDDFARIYREVMKVATEIDDRDILIQIV